MSLSVKDRAKMFGALASPSSSENERSFRRVGSRVSSSPFKTPASPALGNNVSSSPFKNVPPSPARTSTTPARYSISNVPIPAPSSNSPSWRKASADRASFLSGSPGVKKSTPWLDEDAIPTPTKKIAPSPSPVSKFSQSSSPFKVLSNTDNQGRMPSTTTTNSKAVVVDPPQKVFQRDEELFNQNEVPISSHGSKQKLASKFSQNASPFKVLSNTDNQERMPNTTSTKAKTVVVDPLEVSTSTGQEKPKKKEGEISSRNSKQTMIATVRNGTGMVERPKSESQSVSEPNQDENKPVNTSAKNKSTRAMRLMKARRAQSHTPLLASKSLKQSLEAAKVVLQEEKTEGGASDTSSRSSLSNKELSEIAKKALKRSKNKIQSTFNEKKPFKEHAMTDRVNETSKHNPLLQCSSTSSHKGKCESDGENGKTKSGTDVLHNVSANSRSSSGRGRRMQHPAFRTRSGKSNVSSTNILASFRQFNATRPITAPRRIEKSVTKDANEEQRNELERSLSVDESLSSGASMASLEQDQTMHSVNELHAESIRSVSMRQGESMRSMTERLGESMHSTSSRVKPNLMYRGGRVHVITKNNCNDTVMSSLSGNTHSVQSIMSQAAASRMKSPVNEKASTLDPTTDFASQPQKEYFRPTILSPGPSNRSGHSFANSIDSATPRDTYRSPTFRDKSTSKFLDTLEETQTMSQESYGNSAELLDAALEAAIEDMSILSPTSVPSAGFNQSPAPISILPSSSARSQSPPGFVFKDTEESDVMAPLDPVGCALADSVIDEETNFQSSAASFAGETSSTTSNGQSHKTNESFSFEVNEGLLHCGGVENIKEVSSNFKQGSTSTKQTVSTSIRSGMSSIQNGAAIENAHTAAEEENRDPEGSTSIRTGLSGIQSQRETSDLENSISIHDTPGMALGSEMKHGSQREKAPVMIPPSYPDTIEEESVAKSTQKSSISVKEDNGSTSVLKLKATDTTEGSSGPGTTHGNSSAEAVSTDQSIANMNIAHTQQPNITPLQTDDIGGDEVSNNGLSLLSPGSRASRSLKNFGNAIKNVLAKASPRQGHKSRTPSNQSNRDDMDECESLFSDDDDDIFGGLEVEEVAKTLLRRKPKIDDETPKQKNFRTEGSLSYRMSGTTSRRMSQGGKTPSHRSRGVSGRSNTTVPRSGTPSNRNSAHSQKIGTPRSNVMKSLSRTPSQNRVITSANVPDPVTSSNAVGTTANDKSGMILDEAQVVNNVHSDITSSLIGGPFSGPSPFQKAMAGATKLLQPKEDQSATEASEMESGLIKEDAGETFTLLMEDTYTSIAEGKESVSVVGETSKLIAEEGQTVDENRDDEEEKGSMFFNFSCGFVDPCGGFASLCASQNAEKSDDEGAEETVLGDAETVSSRSQLTSLEKKVWNEWDRLNESVLSPKSTDKTTGGDTKTVESGEKPLDMESTAFTAYTSAHSENSTHLDNDNCTKTILTEDQTVSASGSTDTESGASRNSSGTESGDSLASSSHESSDGYTTGYSTAGESDDVSYDRSRRSHAEDGSKRLSTPLAGPILLSFSQRSLMEKFSKQLTAVGVQVLKLNTRNQWQTRYFTVSKEQIALSAHEAISKTGEIAQCPKALLWLKKFSPKNGGYGIINIDKNGHGGMLLVDLIDIQVSDSRVDMVRNPIPKKLMEKFENSVLVTLKYKMKGALRSIEFRCRDNDEAQFLCTCMRVIRDLLRRERSLRQKLSKRTSSKSGTPTSYRTNTPTSSRR